MSNNNPGLSSKYNYNVVLQGTVAPRKFGQLTDVNMVSVQDGDFVAYDEATKTFIPVSRNDSFPDELNIILSGISTNVIGGIASVTSLSVSGVSTLGFVTATNSYFSGVVTATTFVGNLSGNSTTAGIATYAITAGISTVSQGLTGTPNITVGVITASTFIGNLTGTATTATNVIGGIASVTSLDVSGISTLGSVQISSGIITATSGIITYYGDGSNLTGISGGSGVNYWDSNISGISTSSNVGLGTDSPQYQLEVGYPGIAGTTLYVHGNARITGILSVGNSTITLDPITNTINVGSGITISADSNTIQINGSTIGSPSGDALYIGIVTAATFVGDLTGTATSATSSNYALVSGISTSVIGGIASVTSLDVSGISTLGSVQISSGIITATSGIITYYGDGSKLSNIISGVGIQSSGVTVGSGITTLNFIGAGNTFSVDGSTVNISIQGGGGTSSQWVTTSAGIHTLSNVGIGTTNPIEQFQVGFDTSAVVVTGIGSVGIGTTNPTTKLHVVGDVNLDDGGTFTTTVQTVTPTANRTLSFPDATGTIALVAGSSTQLIYNLSGAYSGVVNSGIDTLGNVTLGSRLTSSLNGAASAPPVSLTGTWFTGGSSTTTKPQLLIEPSGTTSTSWSTSGTGLGLNAASGFAGNLLDLQMNGTSSFAVIAGANYVLDPSYGLRKTTIANTVITGGTTGNSNVDLNGATVVLNSITFSRVNQNLKLEYDAANTLAQRNGTNAQTFRVYNTYTSSTNYELGKLEWTSNIFRIGTEKGSAGGTPRTLELQTDGTTRVAISTTGLVGIGTTIPTSTLHVVGNSIISGISTLGTVRVSSGIVTASSGIVTYYGDGSNLTRLPTEIGLACSDETTDLTTGTAKATFRMPYAMTLTSVRANVNTAPSGAAIVINIKESGTTIFSTKPQIDSGSLTSIGSTVTPVISDANLADDAEIKIDIDQVGVTTAGKGLKVWLIGTRA